jgi:hypothetical protein
VVYVPPVPPFQCQGNDVDPEVFATLVGFEANETVEVYWSSPGRAESLLSDRPADANGDRTLGWRCEAGGVITFRAVGLISGGTITFDLPTLPSERCVPESVTTELPFDLDGDPSRRVTRPITDGDATGRRDAGCASPSVGFSLGDLIWVTGETDTYYRARRPNDPREFFVEKDAIAFDRVEPGPVADVDAEKISACETSREDFTDRFVDIYLDNADRRGDDSGNALAFLTNLAAFRNLVQTGAPLDIKNNEPILIRARNSGCGVIFFGQVVQQDVPGNVLYGMIGYRFFYETQRLGESAADTTLLLVAAAGAAQQGDPVERLLDADDWTFLATGDPACDTYAVLAGTGFEESGGSGRLVDRTASEVRSTLTSRLASIDYLYDPDSWCVNGAKRFYPEFSCNGRGHPYGVQRDPIRVCI